jgi:hypothetical protein
MNMCKYDCVRGNWFSNSKFGSYMPIVYRTVVPFFTWASSSWVMFDKTSNRKDKELQLASRKTKETRRSRFKLRLVRAASVEATRRARSRHRVPPR